MIKKSIPWKLANNTTRFVYCFVLLPFPRKPAEKHLTAPIIRNLSVLQMFVCLIPQRQDIQGSLQLLYHCLSADKDHPMHQLTLFANFRMWDFRFLGFANSISYTKCLPWELILHGLGVHRVRVFLRSWVKGKNQTEECVGAVVCVSFQGIWFGLFVCFSFYRPALHLLWFSYVNLSCWIKIWSHVCVISPEEMYSSKQINESRPKI